MPQTLEQLRRETLANNLTWLRSFGCRVREEGEGVVSVEHAALPEYCALLLMSPGARPLAALADFLARADEAGFARDVYVDEELEGQELEGVRVPDALAARGFVSVSANSTTAGVWTPPGEAPRGLVARAALPEERARWSALYSEGFGRDSREARIDLARWDLSFRSREVSHWFFVRENGEEVGVCQTCEASGVTGVYSFTLTRAARSARALVPAARALRARLAERGGVTVYFERAKRERARLPRHRLSPPLTPGFKIIRLTTGYRRPPDRR